MLLAYQNLSSALSNIVPFFVDNHQSVFIHTVGVGRGVVRELLPLLLLMLNAACMCLLVLYVVGHRDYIIPPVRKDSLVADPTTSPRSPYILPPPPPETRMKVQVLTHNGSISSDTE